MGFTPRCCRLIVKILRGKKITVVGDGDERHTAPRGFLGKLLDFASAVEKAVVSVQMQVNKLRLAHGI